MNWKKVKLGEIIHAKTGKLDANAQVIGGKYPFFTCSQESLQIDSFSYDCECVLIAGNGDLNVKYYNGKFDAYQRTYIVESKDSLTLNVRYLYHFMSKYVEKLRSDSIGGVIKYIKIGNITDAKIPLPDLATQKHIAEVLDKADALRQQNRQLLANYDELLQSTFIELFGDPVKNPKGWEVRKLDKVCTQITDGTHFSPPSVDSGVPYITAKHVKDYGVDFYSKPTYVSIEEHVKIYARCKPKKGDVLYIKDGATTGIAAVNPYDFEFSMLSSLALIKPQKKELTSQFLVSWLNSEQVKENLINEFMAGAAIKRFTLQKIKSFQIPVPPLPLQQHFAKIVEQIEAQKAQAQTALAESEALFEGLLAGYFNA